MCYFISFSKIQTHSEYQKQRKPFYSVELNLAAQSIPEWLKKLTAFLDSTVPRQHWQGGKMRTEKKESQKGNEIKQSADDCFLNIILIQEKKKYKHIRFCFTDVFSHKNVASSNQSFHYPCHYSSIMEP